MLKIWRILFILYRSILRKLIENCKMFVRTSMDFFKISLAGFFV